MKDLID
jgi:hypothetical protein